MLWISIFYTRLFCKSAIAFDLLLVYFHYILACYRLVTTDRGTISSPHFPSACGSSALCLYHISLPVGSKLKLEFQGFGLSGSNYLKIQNSSNALDGNFKRVTNVASVQSQEYGNQIKLELWCNPPSSGFKLFYYDNQGRHKFLLLH